MAALGWCPSGRLFEAAACGTPIVSDWWEGLDEFFAPQSEIIVARTTNDVLAALERRDTELSRIGAAARERVLTGHTAARRLQRSRCCCHSWSNSRDVAHFASHRQRHRLSD